MREAAGHLLIVDDDPVIRQMLADLLADEGYGVQQAVNGVDALRKVRADRPAAVVADVCMPVMGGTELAEELSATAGFADLPLILLTGNDEAEWGAHIKACIHKPFEIDELLLAIERALGRGTTS